MMDSVQAGVMELADVTDSKSVGLITRAGSTPATGTTSALHANRHTLKTSVCLSCRYGKMIVLLAFLSPIDSSNI